METKRAEWYLEREWTTVCVNGKYHLVWYANSSYGDSKNWLVRNEYGYTALIKADTWDQAWDEYIDNEITINEDELTEAFDNTGENLIEGYEYQPNFTDTGVVNVGHYISMEEIDFFCQIDKTTLINKAEIKYNAEQRKMAWARHREALKSANQAVSVAA